jgi:F0F1-type ATP synthase epsilon subunit
MDPLHVLSGADGLTCGGRQQVNIPTTSGDMGILSQHVPSITQLRPGVVEIISEGNTGDKWFGIYPPPCNCTVFGTLVGVVGYG